MSPSTGSTPSLVSLRRRWSSTISPGVSRLPLLVCLCRSCHTRVHRLRVVRRAVYLEAFLILWREQYPRAPEQLPLAFHPGASRPQPRSLFAGGDADA
jgi:hypothetical protein